MIRPMRVCVLAIVFVTSIAAAVVSRPRNALAQQPARRAEPVWTRSDATKSPPSSGSKVVLVQAVLPPVPEPILPPPLPAVGARADGGTVIDIDALVRHALERNPRLARAAFAAAAAQGRTIQAGLYPNPVLSVTGDEIGDRTGPGGIWTAPQFNQEIVTGKKLSLSQAVAAREADRANLAVLNERYFVVSSVRAAFYEVYALQRRVEILDELVKLAGQSAKTGKDLFDKGGIAELDLNQLELEYERVRADKESAEREVPAAFRRLAAVVGEPRLAQACLAGHFEAALPDYDLEHAAEVVRQAHPELRSAKANVERAQLALRRAQAEPIPNVTVSGGYVRQNQNRSSDWMIGVSLPIPAWNRNQGGIRAAQAEVGVAVQEVARTENELVERLAAAHRTYAGAKRRADRYRAEIIPRAEKTFRLSSLAFKGGQFEYLRVLQAQRALTEARLEYNRALGEAWRGAAEISGLLLEEVWPARATPKP